MKLQADTNPHFLEAEHPEVVLVDTMQIIVHAAQQYPAFNLSSLGQVVEKESHQSKTRSTKVQKGELK
jgi:hypothetical protein